MPRIICMNGIEENHSRDVAVFHDELKSLVVIGDIGIVFQILDFIQIFFVERIGEGFPIIIKSCFTGRLALFQGLKYGGIISVFVFPYGGVGGIRQRPVIIEDTVLFRAAAG